jgi:methyl-accepting chemotaxis protein
MLDAMRDVNARIASMDRSMSSLDTRIGGMSASVESMNHQMAAITAATQHISGNVSGLNQNIGRPMNFMNSIMPW